MSLDMQGKKLGGNPNLKSTVKYSLLLLYIGLLMIVSGLTLTNLVFTVSKISNKTLDKLFELHSKTEQQLNSKYR